MYQRPSTRSYIVNSHARENTSPFAVHRRALSPTERTFTTVSITEQITPIPTTHQIVEQVVDVSASYAALQAENSLLRSQLAQKDLSEADISKLRQNIASLERRNQSLMTENERMATAYQEKLREVKTWKAKFVEAEKESSRVSLLISENQRLNEQVAHLRMNNADLASQQGQVSELSVQINTLIEERGRLAELLNEREVEFDSLRSEAQEQHDQEDRVSLLLGEKDKLLEEMERLTALVAEKMRDIEEMSATIAQVEALENRITTIEVENHELNQIITHHVHEKSELKAKADLALTLEHHVEALSSQNKNLEKSLGETEKRLKDSQLRIAKYAEESVSLEALSQKVGLLIAENERVHTAARNKEEQISALRARCAALELAGPVLTELGAKAESLDAENAQYIQEIHNLNLIIGEKAQEIDALCLRISSLEEFEGQVAAFEQERMSLHALLNERAHEVFLLKGILSEFEAKDDTIMELDDKITLLIEENERLVALVSLKTQEVEEWAAKYVTLQSLYLEVKEATAQLEIVKQKYSSAVLKTEESQHKMKLIVDVKHAKQIVSKSIDSSAAKTAESVNASPLTANFEKVNYGKSSFVSPPSHTKVIVVDELL